MKRYLDYMKGSVDVLQKSVAFLNKSWDFTEQVFGCSEIVSELHENLQGVFAQFYDIADHCQSKIWVHPTNFQLHCSNLGSISPCHCMYNHDQLMWYDQR